jgi:hypothetical protein
MDFYCGSLILEQASSCFIFFSASATLPSPKLLGFRLFRESITKAPATVPKAGRKFGKASLIGISLVI